ncbi:hypothetical protein CLV30_105197 [Haloactinopolyspora alba]|uniref:Capsular polysaccharide biosynthesis protein n=1 Tax=Haloactinopolyspora alba TaxID=648780 RepID=A0A2P8E5J5_9ACTN|nr:hypothetical protein [Haloactinopolyspora alba]PSL04730.1 hypothetical protein CLV30_105197 [Haloactinopolyspora alba]
MDVWRITVAALRRWYVLLPLLALTGVAVITAGNGVAPEYEAHTSAMITPARVEAAVPNPYGELDSANAALGIVLDSAESRRAIQQQGLDAAYEIGAESRSALFQIASRADDPEIAERTGAAVLELARQELATRQTEAGLNEAARYSLAVLEPPAVVSTVQTGKTRVQAVVGVLGAGLSLLVAVLFDDIVGLVRRFRSNRTRSRAATTTSAAPWDGVSSTRAAPWDGVISPTDLAAPSRTPGHHQSAAPGRGIVHVSRTTDPNEPPADGAPEPSDAEHADQAGYEVSRRS